MKPAYIIIDAEISRTGIIHQHEEEEIEPAQLGLSRELLERFQTWLKNYQNEHFNGFSKKHVVEELDVEGLRIARRIKHEIGDLKVTYRSAATLKSTVVE